MTTKSTGSTGAQKPKQDEAHPGMMGDGTEEQNLNQPGKPGARITKEEADAAFDKAPPAKSK
ncbi:MAG TPA: hypothetical protein VGP48_00830 [Stellaceae bacterium]|jgi:hypothetical protein|nr:hypothetical protein [Stellaceae bacterium]